MNIDSIFSSICYLVIINWQSITIVSHLGECVTKFITNVMMLWRVIILKA